MQLIYKLTSLRVCVIIFLLSLAGSNCFAQLTLGNAPYTEKFDGLPVMPAGWTVRTGATATSLGGLQPVVVNTWTNTTAEFRSVAAAEAPQTAVNSGAIQAAATDRALAVRPTSAMLDPFAAFTLQIDNTTGKTGFSIFVKHMTFDDNPTRTSTYSVQYTTAAAGTSGWTTIGTYTTLTWGATAANYNLGSAIDNIPGTVWIRVVSLNPSTGSGSRDTYGIDDFSLNWTGSVTPDINITSPNLAAPAGNTPQGSLNNVLYRADLSVASSSAVLADAFFTTSAGYVSTDIANFKLWYQTGSSFTGAGTLLGTLTGAIGPGIQDFSGLDQTLPIGTGFLFVTADIACGATNGNSFNINAVGTGNFTFTTSNKTITPAPSAGGLQTIVPGGTPVNVSSATAAPANGQITIAWTNPLCYNEIMIVATDNAAVTSVPTGDGSLYTANTIYNDGTNFPNLNANEFCIYRGGTSPVIMDNLVNGTTYRLTIFTRIGTSWSTGVNLSATPAAVASASFRSISGGQWNDYTIWQKFTGSWVAAGPGEFPNSVIFDVEIQPGHIVTLNARGYAVKNLLVDATAKLYCNTNIQNKFLNIYGDIQCNGTIGNGATPDDICFNFNGAVAQLYGTGNFSCGRIRKNTGANVTTALTINMNVNTYWPGTQLYNNYTGSPNAFNVTINNNFTCNNGGSVAVDGVAGGAFGSSYGAFTVNGTLTIPGILYLTTNNTSPYNCGVSIGATGIVNAATVSMAASTGTATHSLSVASGGKLNITGTSGITPFSATGNTYTLSAGSTVEYSAAGAEPVQAALPYSNLTISGSGTKTATGNVSVGNIFLLVAGTYSMSGLQVNVGANGTVTGNGGNFAAGASGGTVSFAGNGTINGTSALTFRNLTINAGTVTTTLNNCNALTLNLTGGTFSIGSANQFNILAGGTVNAVSGDFATGVNGGLINFPGTGTFSGNSNPYNVYVSGGVNFGAGTVTIQNGGSFRINTGGFANSNGPFYATNSSLVYNTGFAFTAATEWYAAVSSGRGVPYHVTILASGTAVTFGASASSRTMLGDLTISSGAGFALGTVSGGDLLIAGNWTRAATATFTSNARKVTFNGTTTSQTIRVTGGGNENFGYISINKAAGLKVIQAAAPNATNIILNGNPASVAPGNSLIISNGDLDLNQQTFNFTSWNGNQNNIQIDGSAGNLARNIMSSGGAATFAIFNSNAATHNLIISRASATASLLVFGTGVTITNGAVGIGGGGIDFGNTIATVNGTLQLNSYGFVTGNPPAYGNNSFLIYNSGGSFDRNVEWGSLSGPGYPYHVTVQNSTFLQLNFPAINGNADRAIAGNLSIASGSAVLLSTTAGNKLTVGNNLLLNGTLTLPTVTGGDIYIGGNWNRSSSGVFTSNDRAVFFNSSAASTITANGGQLFPYLYLTKNSLANTLILLDDISISKEFGITTGTFDLASKNATLKSDAAGTAGFGKVGAAGDVNYSGAGRFIVERYIPTGIAGGQHFKSWQYLAVPDNGGQTINAGWQEGNVLPIVGAGGLGIIISNNTAGAGFDIIAGSGPSMKTYLPSSALWTGVPNTTATSLFNQNGYMVLVRGDRTVSAYNTAATPTTLRSTGKLFVPGSNPPVSTTIPAGKFESIGNPYASAIDFLNITRAGAPAIDSVFYVWDPLLVGTNTLGAFQTISSVTGYKPTPGGTANYSSAVSYTKIQSGQAFMMHATGAGGTVSFTENAKLSGSDMVYRPAPAGANGRQYLRAELYSVNGALLDANAVAFDHGFNNVYESNDALKILNAAENFGIRSNGQVLVIEARSPVISADTIQYFLTNTRQPSYRFRFIPENINVAGMTAWLEDKVLHTKINISLVDTTTIDFALAISQETMVTDRFMLVFSKKAGPSLPGVPTAKKESTATGKIFTNTVTATTMGVRVYPNPVVGKEMQVIFSKLAEGNYKLQLMTITGQAVYEAPVFVTGNYFKDVVKLGKTAAGYYQLIVTATDGSNTTQSVIIQ